MDRKVKLTLLSDWYVDNKVIRMSDGRRCFYAIRCGVVGHICTSNVRGYNLTRINKSISSIIL